MRLLLADNAGNLKVRMSKGTVRKGGWSRYVGKVVEASIIKGTPEGGQDIRSKGGSIVRVAGGGGSFVRHDVCVGGVRDDRLRRDGVGVLREILLILSYQQMKSLGTGRRC